jgi:hypothetical protein
VPVIPPRYRADAGHRPCSLGEACRESGLDEGGERCPNCALKQLCESETRWLVSRSELPRYLN